ncbi:MAG: S41 family peptidase [Armatimonadota bacterium]|nr:S41 family peptidase [Armatimonadota bacterium]
MKRSLCAPLLALALVLSSPALAQLDRPALTPIVGARRPALSPDGTQLAFVYRGDVWVVPSTGGRAYRLTDHVETETNPLFSPDGEWVAFSSLRNGNYDIYVVPTAGGSPRQITFSGWSEVASDWSPDGRAILFAGERDATDATLFAVDVKTLQFRKLGTDYRGILFATFSPDGQQIVYGRHGFPWYRPRYVGSAAAQIWLLTAPEGEAPWHQWGPEGGRHRAVTRTNRQHLWPRFLPDNRTIVCVTVGEVTPATTRLGEQVPKLVDNERRTPNLWAFTQDGRGRQLTRFVGGGGVRWPAVARRTGDVAFEYGDGIWILEPEAREPTKVTIYASTDEKENSVQRETLTTGVTEAELSPDGKSIAFVLKGDIWTIPTEKPKKRNADDAARLTDHPGEDYDLVWGKDNKHIFFVSDRASRYGLYSLDVQSKVVKPLWQGDGDAFHPQVTPDGKLVAFWASGAKAGLYTVPVEGGEAKCVLDLPGTGGWGPGGREFSFSPDMQWVAFTRVLERGVTGLWIAPAAGGAPINVSRMNASYRMPVWSKDGKYLFFQSNRAGDGLYALPLRREDARSDDLEMKWVLPKEKGAVRCDIDFQDANLRIRRHGSQIPQGSLAQGPDGTLYFLSGGDAWSLSYDGKEAKRLTATGGYSILRVQEDGKRLMLVKDGGLQLLTLGGANPVAGVTFSAEWERDLRLERKAAFIQFWRAYDRSFYDENFHGRDWAAIRDRYEPLLEGVGTRDEFATVLSMMVGELEASHSEVQAAPGTAKSPSTPHLGFTFDYSWAGPGIRVKEVPERAPGSFERTRISPGEYVLAVNGREVRLDEYLFRTLNDFYGKDVELLVNKTPDVNGARKVTYKALSSGEWNDIAYRNRIDRLRKEVETRSKGRIGYVHLSGMGVSNQQQFEREFYEHAVGKDAMIVDVRFNGGGNIADDLTTWLAIRPYEVHRARYSPPEPMPSRAWDKPMVVLHNEFSLSNAEMFPYDMKQTGLATLVGMPTPGYVIWTSSFTLLDGTRARMPGRGVWRRDGTPMENLGQKPDIQVDLTAEDWIAQRDPQLAAAIDRLMRP